MYKAAPLWMTTTISSKTITQLNRQHYRALLAAFKDGKCMMKKEELNSHSGKATLQEWSKYIVTSTFIKMKEKGHPHVQITLKIGLHQ